MTKTFCPAKCGKKFITKEHAEAHADSNHFGWREIPEAPSLRKGWVTPYGFLDFFSPVSYEHALEVANKLTERKNNGGN